MTDAIAVEIRQHLERLGLSQTSKPAKPGLVTAVANVASHKQKQTPVERVQ